MPFDHGTITFTICPLSAPMPEDFLEKFAANAAGKLEDVREEPEIGWVSGRFLLETEIDETTSICGGHLYLNQRKAERKIPASLLNAICKRDELAYMQANETFSVPRLEKKRIKEEAIKRNLMKMPPTITGTPIVVDRTENILYIGTASMSQVDTIIAAFASQLGIEPIPINTNELMFKLFSKESSALPNLLFTKSKSAAETDLTPGRDFLTWLWYFSELNGGELEIGDLGTFQLGIEGPLTFAFSAEAKGAEESVVKKGCPQLSAEAKAALAVGKKLKKAKIMMARGQEVWAFTFDADRFNFSGMTLPEGEETDRDSYFAERIQSLSIFRQALEGYFRKFVECITGATHGEVEKDIKKWAEDRESY